jgi:hypothetical protein
MESKGIVEAVSNKDGRYGVKLNGLWFNGFGTAECKKGDSVKITYEQSGKFNNVTEITGGSAETPEEKVSSNNRIDEATRLRRKTDVVLKVFDGFLQGKVEEENITTKANELLSYIEEKVEVR